MKVFEFGRKDKRIDGMSMSIRSILNMLSKHGSRLDDVERYTLSNGLRLDEVDESVRFNECGQETTNNAVSSRISVLEAKIDPTVECETCGCLLRKGTAIRGESVIEVESPRVWCGNPTESIREIYYCKVHSPCEGECADGGKDDCGGCK